MAVKESPEFSDVRFKARVMEMKQGEAVHFAFGVAGKGGEPALLLHNKKAGKALLGIVLKEKPEVEKGTWGEATLDGNVIVLDCARLVPGIKKGLKAWIQARKHPLIKKGRVLVGGVQVAEEGDEGDETEAPGPGTPLTGVTPETTGETTERQPEGTTTETFETAGETTGPETEGTATATPETTGETTEPRTEGTAERPYAKMRELWTHTSNVALQGVDQLQRELRATGHEVAVEIADIVEQIAEGFPDGMNDTLAALDEAAASGDADRVRALKQQLQQDAKACLQYIKENAEHIAACEENPFGTTVRIREPVVTSLKAILARAR